MDSTSRGLRRFSKASATDSTFFSDRCISVSHRSQCSIPLSPFSNCSIARVLVKIDFVNALFLPITDKPLDYCLYLKHLQTYHHLLIGMFNKVSSIILSTAHLFPGKNDLATLKAPFLEVPQLLGDFHLHLTCKLKRKQGILHNFGHFMRKINHTFGSSSINTYKNYFLGSFYK